MYPSLSQRCAEYIKGLADDAEEHVKSLTCAATPEKHPKPGEVPKQQCASCVQVPVEHNIQLPCAVDPHSASALLTLHGLLFVKVIPANSAAPRGLPKAPKKPPSAPSSAQQGAPPAQLPSSSLAPSKPAEGNEASGDVQGDVASMEA